MSRIWSNITPDPNKRYILKTVTGTSGSTLYSAMVQPTALVMSNSFARDNGIGSNTYWFQNTPKFITLYGGTVETHTTDNAGTSNYKLYECE